MKAPSLRNLVHAHGWVGLIISVPLFIVFWAGSITFFQPEIYRWASTPHFPISQIGTQLNVNTLLEEKLAQFAVDNSRRMFISFPSEHSPYIRVGFSVFTESAVIESEKKRKTKFQYLLIDPISGQTLAEHDPFELADFFYRLHYNLKLPQGAYVVGIVTFFFLVLILTGIVIQLKNLVKHFFLYRSDSTTRNKMHDLHNVVGVISLPYGLMFALTGLMFNLNIIAQIPTVLMLYDGDLNAALTDAGSHTVTERYAGVPYPMPDLQQLKNQLETQHDVGITSIAIYNYGDEHAVVRFRGSLNNDFADRFTRFYQVRTGTFPAQANHFDDNVFANGTRTLYNMHFASFAGLDLRFLYFVLGLGVCVMIIAGNVLWLVKRQKRNATPKTITIMRALTLGACAGIIPVTALTFLLERVLAIDLEQRAHFIEFSFAIGLLLAVIAAFKYKSSKQLMSHYAYGTSLLLAGTVVADWLMFSNSIISMASAEHFVPLSVSVALGVFSLCFALLGKKLKQNGKQTAAATSAGKAEAAY